MCEKMQYDTYKLAKDGLKKVSTKFKQQFRIYKCDECGCFHLTSVKQRKKSQSPKGLDTLKYDTDLKKLRKQLDEGKILPPPIEDKRYSKPTAMFKIGDAFPGMKKDKKP